MFILKLIIWASVLFSITCAAAIPEGTIIRSCGDDAGWPPYTYVTPQDSVAGYDVDILKQILEKHDLVSKVVMLPWKRCLHWAKHGKKYQIALSAGSNPEREKTYLLTRYYYTVTPSYFYSKTNFPDGLVIESVEDFKKYKVCGLLGYNYVKFGIPAEDIDTSAKETAQVVEKTVRKRCDVFLDRAEIFVGFAYMGINYIKDNNLGFAAAPGAQSEKFYLMISRDYEYANELKAIIDTEINHIDSRGDLEKMVDKSIAELKGLFGQ